MATHVPVYTARNYHPDALKVVVRRDLQRTGWAFIASPSYFCADAKQLRHLADAMHDMADTLDGDTE